MANKKKKKNTCKKKKVLKEYSEIKKEEVLKKEINNLRKDNINVELNKGKKGENTVVVPDNIHEKIQTFISLLFTIIVFILLIFLIIVIYNNYLKPKDYLNKDEICQEYIKKDYNIDKEEIKNYIINNRHIIYNLNNFDINNLQEDDLLDIAKYIIWNDDSDYQMCDEDDKCLVTKKEMNYDELINKIETFLQKEDLFLNFDLEQGKDVYLYLRDDIIVLTFNEFKYETYKHDIVDILIDDDNITIYFALSKKVSDNNYSYVGSKKVLLKYKNNEFILNKIETN